MHLLCVRSCESCVYWLILPFLLLLRLFVGSFIPWFQTNNNRLSRSVIKLFIPPSKKKSRLTMGNNTERERDGKKKNLNWNGIYKERAIKERSKKEFRVPFWLHFKRTLTLMKINTNNLRENIHNRRLRQNGLLWVPLHEWHKLCIKEMRVIDQSDWWFFFFHFLRGDFDLSEMLKVFFWDYFNFKESLRGLRKWEELTNQMVRFNVFSERILNFRWNFYEIISILRRVWEAYGNDSN